MAIGIVHGQPFGRGGGVEGLVGGDERDRGETGILLLAVDFEGGGELDGVVGAQRVRVRQPRRLVQQGGRDLDDGVTAVEMLAEAAEDRRRADGARGGVPLRRRATAEVTSTTVMRAM